MIGNTISHYKILEKLGEGGMGVVYKAEDTKLDRTVALKFLPVRLTENETEKARFLQEAKAASAISHPNVCVIHDIQEYEDQQFIIMEYIEGVTLRQKLQKASLALKDVIDCAIQIAEALGAAHGKGIVHRDVKSDNIMITPAGQVKVMDFGLAKLKGSVKLTKTSSTVGTLSYMSPEHIQGGNVDARSDIFSFGVVLYEMLAGRLPFEGEYDSALMYAILNEQPEPVQTHRPDLSPEFVHVINRALEKEADDRYQSINDLLIDLRRLKRDSDKVSRASLDGISSTASGQRTIARERSKSASPYHRIIWPIVALAGVAAVIVLLVLKYTGSEQPAPQSQQMQITRVTYSGKAKEAAVSPDGNYIVYIQTDKGKESLWLRQVATNSNIEILDPREVKLSGLKFSPDGNYVYYITERAEGSVRNILSKIPVLGGNPVKVLEDVPTPITFSPDGERFAFVRYDWQKNSSSLVIANKDGSGQRTLAEKKFPGFFGRFGAAWSPDGKVIACEEVVPDRFDPSAIIAVSVDDGSISRIGSLLWGAMGGLHWLNDGSGLIFPVAVRSTGYFYQVWYASYPNGTARRITNDLNNYLYVSLTADSRTLITVQSEWLSNLWTAPFENLGNARQISSGKYDGYFGVSWTPDGRIVHGSRDFNIWLMEADGSNPRLLTMDEPNNWRPMATPDGRYIVFCSWREGGGTEGVNVWRMDMDGGNLKCMVSNVTLGYPSCSPDGKWIAFHSWISGGDLVTLHRVSIDGGEPIQLNDDWCAYPAISPDGTMIACYYRVDFSQPEGMIALIPSEGGDTIKTFEVSPDHVKMPGIRWLADGSAVTYVTWSAGASNIWSQPIDGSPPIQLTQFTSKRIFAFDWSHDGKHLVCARGDYEDDVVMIKNFR
jgi:serine/threonine protein kinase